MESKGIHLRSAALARVD